VWVDWVGVDELLHNNLILKRARECFVYRKREERRREKNSTIYVYIPIYGANDRAAKGRRWNERWSFLGRSVLSFFFFFFDRSMF
jgi:hypothetical protein